MGMFDWIKYEADCQSCGESVKGFQSKDGKCELREMTPEELFKEAGSGARFYTSCEKCKLWDEYTFKPPTELEIVGIKREEDL